jgi:hypothetical protein
MISTLPSASVPSTQVMPFVGQSASVIPLSLLPAGRPRAVLAAAGGLDTGWGAWKPTAPAGASARAHLCAEQQKHAVALERFAVSASAAASSYGSNSNGITFGNQVQTQLNVDVTRVDGRAGSPPRGTPA